MRSFILDDYRDRAPLRVGCLSQCFSAECTSDGVNEIVLLKQLLPAHAREPETVAAWLSVAEENTTLQHPGCIKVLDFGLTAGDAYMVLEQVHGSSLRELLQGAHQAELWPSVEAVVALAQAGLDALAHAHDLGLAHLDLDPHALILQRDGNVVLTEFGMWRALPAASATRERFDKGRVAYLAPELVKSHTADARSDVFSLGVILYELLAHKRPFAGPTQLVTAMLIAEGKRRPLRELAPALPEMLCDIVETMLAVSPDERFQSARAALGALASTSVADQVALVGWIERLELRAGPHGITRAAGPASGTPLAPIPQTAVRDTVSLPVLKAAVPARASEVEHRSSAPNPLAPAALPESRNDSAPLAPPPLLSAQPPAAALGPSSRELASDWLAPPPMLSPSASLARSPEMDSAPEAPVRDGKTAFLDRGSVAQSLSPKPVEGTAPGFHSSAPATPPLANFAAPAAPSFQAPLPAPRDSYQPLSTPPFPSFQPPVERPPEPARPLSLPSLPDMTGDSFRDQRWQEPSKTVFQMKRFAKSATRRGDARAPLYVIVLLAIAFGFALVAGVVLLWRLVS